MACERVVFSSSLVSTFTYLTSLARALALKWRKIHTLVLVKGYSNTT